MLSYSETVMLVLRNIVTGNTSDSMNANESKLVEFERAGTEKYLYSERRKQEKLILDKKTDSMLHE